MSGGRGMRAAAGKKTLRRPETELSSACLLAQFIIEFFVFLCHCCCCLVSLHSVEKKQAFPKLGGGTTKKTLKSNSPKLSILKFLLCLGKKNKNRPPTFFNQNQFVSFYSSHHVFSIKKQQVPPSF